MKARFGQTPFRPLSLRPAECERYARLADELLRGVLSEYDHFGPPSAPRVFSKSRWKVVKAFESFTAYQDRAKSAPHTSRSSDTSTHDATTTRSDSDRVVDDNNDNNDNVDNIDNIDIAHDSVDWKMPELVVSGVVSGTLEDVLFGMTAHDSAAMLLRTAYVDESWLDAAVLFPIALPTVADPFRFLGVKWCVKRMPKKFSGVVQPRDFLFLEASGLLTRSDGRQVGYFLRHPVDIAGCPELTAHGVVRGRFTSAAIFTPLPETGAVDVFVRGRASPSGKLPLSIAVALTANALLSAANAVGIAHSKKLAWLFRRARATAAATATVSGPALLAETSRRCVVCIRRFSKLSSVVTCSVCGERICSRCRLWRSLSFVDPHQRRQRQRQPTNPTNNHNHKPKQRTGGHQLKEMTGTFCKNCVSTANNASALEIARQEVLSGRYGPVEAAADETWGCDNNNNDTTSELAIALAAGVDNVDNDGNDDGSDSAIVVRDASLEAAAHWADGDDDVDELHLSGRGWTPAHPYANDEEPTSSRGNPSVQERQALWRKMAELREQAEHVYALTKHTSTLHLTTGGSASNSVEQCDSEVDELD